MWLAHLASTGAGYGSYVVLLPEYGTGIFAFANRTYAGPSPPVWAAALALMKAGRLTPEALPVSSALSTAYAAAGRIFASGSITGGGDVLAMNMLMDRDVEHWARELADREGIDLAASYFYTDSITDLPLLDLVGHPVAVNPDPFLYRTAVRRRWPVRFFEPPEPQD